MHILWLVLWNRNDESESFPVVFVDLKKRRNFNSVTDSLPFTAVYGEPVKTKMYLVSNQSINSINQENCQISHTVADFFIAHLLD